MKKKIITDNSIRARVKRHTGKSGHRKIILMIAALAGGSYAAYRYVRIHKARRAQELSEKLRSGTNKMGQNDNECSSAYFKGYKNGLDDGYDEGYERGHTEGHYKGCDDGYLIGYEEALKKCIKDVEGISDEILDKADEYEQEDEIHEDSE